MVMDPGPWGEHGDMLKRRIGGLDVLVEIRRDAAHVVIVTASHVEGRALRPDEEDFVTRLFRADNRARMKRTPPIRTYASSRTGASTRWVLDAARVLEETD